MNIVRTNAIRLLESGGVAFGVHSYTVDEERLDAVSVAGELRVEPERIFKTLVTIDRGDNPFVFCVPGNATLDLKKAATVAGTKRVEMLPLKRLKPLTGYIHGACSPFAMLSPLPTAIDETVELFDTVFVSAGKRGMQIEIAPRLLIEKASARIADLV